MKQFTQTLFNIRERHANTVPTMAEAVMEVKNNYSGKGKVTLEICLLKSVSQIWAS
jgi:hypothetical protein